MWLQNINCYYYMLYHSVLTKLILLSILSNMYILKSCFWSLRILAVSCCFTVSGLPTCVVGRWCNELTGAGATWAFTGAACIIIDKVA